MDDKPKKPQKRKKKANPLESPKRDRDEKGRLLPGHSIKSPGRPPRVTEVQYLDKLREKVTLDKWGEMVDAMVRKALKVDSGELDLSDAAGDVAVGAKLVR